VAKGTVERDLDARKNVAMIHNHVAGVRNITLRITALCRIEVKELQGFASATSERNCAVRYSSKCRTRRIKPFKPSPLHHGLKVQV